MDIDLIAGAWMCALLIGSFVWVLTMYWWVPLLAQACGVRKVFLRTPFYILPVAVLALCIWRLFVVNPLPRDDELIEHFREHSADIEVLIKAYYRAPQSSIQWDDALEIQALKKLSGVERIHQVMGWWPADPYSFEGAEGLHKLITTNTPEAYAAIRQMEALQVDLVDSRYRQRSLRYPTDYHILKSLLYIPAVARTHDAKLWPGVSWNKLAPQTPEQYEKSAWRLLPKLSDYPPNWKKGECVFRQLDTHWFIVMCRAA